MKKLTLFVFMLLTTSIVFGQEFTENTKIVTTSSIGLGSVIAVVTSWDRNKSILWAILHGILSWFYVIYFAFTR